MLDYFNNQDHYKKYGADLKGQFLLISRYFLRTCAMIIDNIEKETKDHGTNWCKRKLDFAWLEVNGAPSHLPRVLCLITSESRVAANLCSPHETHTKWVINTS